METDIKNKVEDIYELSPMQQGMLFHTLYEEGSDAYFEQFCYDLEGTLDPELFEKAWNEIVKRHGVLRTSFQWKGISKPVQVVNRSVSLPWENISWTDVPAENIENEFLKFIKADRAKGFSMEQAPLMRCALIRINESSFKFIWSFHHILMDGWSYPVIQKEVFEIYESLKKNEQTVLPKPVSFKQFIVWLNKTDKNSAKTFWEKELKGFSSPTPMTYGRNESDGEVKDIEIKFNEKLTADLSSFVRENKLTVNSIIQGIWALILSKYRNENDVLFGGTVSGRNPQLPGIESMVGLFINTLPVRINIDYDKDIKTWLKELQTKQIERDQFAYSSLVDIQEWSEIPRGTQLFENILVFENYPVDKSLEDGVAGIKIKNLKAFERTNFPLTVLIAPGKEMSVHIAFETSKFTDDFINKILSNFKSLVSQIIKDPDSKLSGLTLLSEEERNKILFEWNDTAADVDIKCMHEMFTDAAKKFPDRTALESGNKKYTYKELDELSNRLANRLIKKGITPGDCIGICLKRSAEMIISLLGILKSGAAYVPVDPSFPEDRIQYLIEDSGVKILITSEDIPVKLESDGSRKIFLIDKNIPSLENESIVAPVTGVTPSDLLYIIYTSGSTGKPKGVLMMHKALSNLLNWQMRSHKFEEGYRVLQFTTLSFDVSFQEIFSTWISGGTLVMLTEEERKDLSQIVTILKKKNIQRIFLPFVALQGISEISMSSGIKDLPLKEVITAGEQIQITPALLYFFNHLKDFTFSNHYGPSEAHVVTSYTFGNDTSVWPGHPPIGKPVFNNRIYILDNNLQPVPAGVTGDLYIGGVSLVRGYLNRDELTKEKFKEDPFINGERIYKTGDLARYLENGDIEFLGRADSQIKLRGYRIELGEIENVISEFDGIKNTAVTAKEFIGGDKRLFAYIVTNDGNEIEKDNLVKFLKSKIPDYMIPQDFIFIKEMPLTGTGKIDLKALPEPELISGGTAEYTEPKDPLELQLVNIWEKVLGIKKIGVNDNFFELGGHSLLAVRVFGYIEKLTGKKLALSTLFNSPTIAQLAVILKNEGWEPNWKSLVPVKPGGSKLPFYCVPPAGGTALHFQDLVKYIPDDQPFYILEALGLDGKNEPHDDIKDMAAHNIKEIRTLQPEGPYLLGGRCFGGRVVFEMAQQLIRQKQQVALLAIFDTWPPFTEKPQDYIPPTRDTRHYITRSFHHIKSGQFVKVAKNYASYRYSKLQWKLKNKIEYIFSNKLDREYKNIMLMHFKTQDKYVAQKYPGKITLIECATFKKELREKWEQLADGGFETYVVPDTDHITIVKEPKLKFFAEKLNFVLEKTHRDINSAVTGNKKSAG